MKSALLDANVWLALAWDGHVHTPGATDWLTTHRGQIAFCRVTLLALLRHLTNEAILGTEVHTNRSAFEFAATLLCQPEIRLLPEPDGLDEAIGKYGATRFPAPKRWTDAYLAAFAVTADLELVTFDRGFRQFDGLDLTLLA